MKCFICNKTLESEEIKQNRDHKDFDPCRGCLEVIYHVFEDPVSEDDVDRLLEADLVGMGMLPEPQATPAEIRALWEQGQ
jgi:hypothetical protein